MSLHKLMGQPSPQALASHLVDVAAAALSTAPDPATRERLVTTFTRLILEHDPTAPPHLDAQILAELEHTPAGLPSYHLAHLVRRRSATVREELQRLEEIGQVVARRQGRTTLYQHPRHAPAAATEAR